MRKNNLIMQLKRESNWNKPSNAQQKINSHMIKICPKLKHYYKQRQEIQLELM